MRGIERYVEIALRGLVGADQDAAPIAIEDVIGVADNCHIFCRMGERRFSDLAPPA